MQDPEQRRGVGESRLPWELESLDSIHGGARPSAGGGGVGGEADRCGSGNPENQGSSHIRAREEEASETVPRPPAFLHPVCEACLSQSVSTCLKPMIFHVRAS